MTVTLVINNQYYVDGINELARLSKLTPQDVCREMLCHAVDNFYTERRKWEEAYVYNHVPERAQRIINSVKFGPVEKKPDMEGMQ